MTYDYCIIGGGIVGLATAMALLTRRPGASLLILEKEASLGRHQTGHNSGVIHAGIYYAPGSLKADLCKRGAQATKDFCTEHGIAFEVCGKLLVASNDLEVQRMQALYERSQQNGLKVERLDAGALREREPNIVGKGALFLDATGIVDYQQVCDAMAKVIRQAGGEVRLSTAVRAIQEHADHVAVSTDGNTWRARQLVACAGLQSDRLARLAGVQIDHQIIPFRGEYYRLPASKNQIVNHLIYPIPDPELPFLGVHLTRMIDGSVTVGPNAVLGFGRENYRKFSVNWRDVAEYARFPGFWKTIWNNLGSGTAEMKNSLFKRGYLEQCRKYCPSLQVEDLLPYEAGIRAQAVMRDGTLVHDFLFAETPRMVHVCNAPSPAATSAIPIGQMIAEKILEAR
ncbi:MULTISPECIES: L-2-hydroxyglutarate oxidase [unclassified Pseudomonas]|uniref:L-2-hydroxyglutarate oxidase n=1 Tax=unclassified Pseudomonas TaxID=196821 RepID=UPI000C88262B|nr:MULTISPECIES: L-2-hydroxyglutarate oxidase [unclassified Pseudomonas]PMZ99829.1 L-2-hydroxyglutarate oxidase [Pseudomonas sp. FW305-42]PNA20876.1 L-2-hydroxyglutarate oxidase [Pseudomonas sp. MPR-R1B]PNB20789.1 L-2-hydroxyglutarate oxidase [Pseudomonas sp. DP16D-E2]PNB42009.1 L-2-hydroxyglutarate oxidase [Pseudomonas sp. FW305-17]PNB63449.1 L-2-hydroxyglutarate oxidase [Pseudomonas sp. GW531-E2]